MERTPRQAGFKVKSNTAGRGQRQQQKLQESSSSREPVYTERPKRAHIKPSRYRNNDRESDE